MATISQLKTNNIEQFINLKKTNYDKNNNKSNYI